MAVLDESVVWGLLGIMALYVFTASAIELWSPVFWVFVFVIAVWVGKDAFFGGVLVWDQWFNWLAVGVLTLFVLNTHFALGALINSGLAFLMVLFVLAMKVDALMH